MDSIHTCNTTPDITHVVFSGGGLKGLCYLGVIRYLYLEKLTDNIRYIAGSSIGAYFGLVLALKIPIDVIEKGIYEMVEACKQKKEMTISKMSFANIFNNYGFFDIHFVMKPIIEFIKDKYGQEDLTFIEFVKKTGINLYVNTTNLNTTKRKVFSVDDTPNVSVINAVIASMTIPLLFKSIVIEGEYYIDGVISLDLPIDIFKDCNKHNILGVLLAPSKDYEPYEKNAKIGFMQYVFRMMTIVVRNLLTKTSTSYDDWFNVMKISDFPYEGVFKFQFTDQCINIDLSKEDMENMILKGFIDITQYMNRRYYCEPKPEQIQDDN